MVGVYLPHLVLMVAFILFYLIVVDFCWLYLVASSGYGVGYSLVWWILILMMSVVSVPPNPNQLNFFQY